jgi:hypothetical protein
MTESALVTQCLRAFAYRSFTVLDPKTLKTGVSYVLKDFAPRNENGFVWRASTGALPARNRFIRFGIAGLPDITGITKHGYWIGCEVKTDKGELSEVQKAFHDAVALCHGLIFVARGYEECYQKLIELGY